MIFLKTFFKRKFQKMTKTVNLNVRVQRISSTSKAQTLLINMCHNYSRGKNVIMKSSMLAFSDDATNQIRVFQIDF